MDDRMLRTLLEECKPYSHQGDVARYIPELAKADPSHLGISVMNRDGSVLSAGDFQQRFTMQSLVKVATLICCLMDNAPEVVARKVTFEPTASSFNSIIDLEARNENRPLNPMINAGAIVTITLIKGETLEEKFRRILDFIRLFGGNSAIDVDRDVYLSEKRTASRNRALAYYMQSTGILTQNDDVEEVLDVYFRACSLSIDCTDLAHMALVLANNGRTGADGSGDAIFSEYVARTVKSVMCLCGLYDESGTWAATVGLPAKSGVGGGIMAVVPGRMGIGVFGPALGTSGTSFAGWKLLHMLSKQADLSIFN